MMSEPQVKCEGCQRVEILKEDDGANGNHPLVAAKRRLKKRCTRAGHVSQPIYTQSFEMIDNGRRS